MRVQTESEFEFKRLSPYELYGAKHNVYASLSSSLTSVRILPIKLSPQLLGAHERRSRESTYFPQEAEFMLLSIFWSCGR